jgi:Cu+-exporting ATPase
MVWTWMVTGDNRTANAISRQLNLSPIGSYQPSSCQSAASSQASGRSRVVVMVGDGLTIPRLAQADIGMSPGTGAEIAAEASDIVLVRGNVTDVLCIDLSRAIFRKIQWNFVFSLLYNCLYPCRGSILPAGPYETTPPTVAAIAMALSSISVVLSSLSPAFTARPMYRFQIADVAVETVHLLFRRDLCSNEILPRQP